MLDIILEMEACEDMKYLKQVHGGVTGSSFFYGFDEKSLDHLGNCSRKNP
jgi:hypothetical protein